jgi:hypothetical protein
MLTLRSTQSHPSPLVSSPKKVQYHPRLTEVLPEPEAAKWRSFSQQVFALALSHPNPGMSTQEQRASLSNKVSSLK